LSKFSGVVFVLVSGQADRQTDILITTLGTPSSTKLEMCLL